jgi:hypothetical protein
MSNRSEERGTKGGGWKEGVRRGRSREVGWVGRREREEEGEGRGKQEKRAKLSVFSKNWTNK